MRKLLAFLFLCSALLGCSNSDESNALLGEWTFAQIKINPKIEGEFPFSPTFDGYIFSGGNKMEVLISEKNVRIPGDYQVADGKLTYHFQPSELSEPLTHEMNYSLDEEARSLSLIVGEARYIYYPPEQFLAYDIAGQYELPLKNETMRMILGENGDFKVPQKNISGHYVLWSSPLGKVLSATMKVKGKASVLYMWLYENTDKQLRITPFLPSGTVEYDRAELWHKVGPS